MQFVGVVQVPGCWGLHMVRSTNGTRCVRSALQDRLLVLIIFTLLLLIRLLFIWVFYYRLPLRASPLVYPSFGPLLNREES